MNRSAIRLATFVLLAAALFGAAAARAATSTSAHMARSSAHTSAHAVVKTSRVVAAPAPALAAAGMRAYRDPETGLVGGTGPLPAIGRDGLPKLDDAPTDLPQVQLPDGSWLMDLQGWFQDYAVLRLDGQGHRVMTCTPHPRAALRNAPVVVAPYAER
jgi:hypothetical protein